jgi:hypothetical protein
LFNKCLETPKQVLKNWQETSLQKLVNTSAFRPFEIASMKVVTKEERQEKKSFINERNRRKRLEFARAYVNKPIDFGKYFYSLMRVSSTYLDLMVLSTFGESPKKELGSKNVIPTVKHGGGHAIVWGCMGYAGVGELAIVRDYEL